MSVFSDTSKNTWESRMARLRSESELDKARVLAEQPDKLEEFGRLWREDLKTYEFRCERYGDFLSLYISRHNQKIVAAINILNSTVNLHIGSEPNLKGGRYCYVNGDSFDWRLPYLPAVSPWPTGHAGIFTTDPAPAQTHGQLATMGGISETHCNYVDNCAQAAVDDRIRFEAAKSTLWVPFGLGAGVFEQILAAST